jgi:hypothetical protein
MSKYRQAAAVDSNQSKIVKALRKIPGVSVHTGVDDIFVGYSRKNIGFFCTVNFNYWYEIKSPDTLNKDGRSKRSAFKKSQIDLLRDWKGHYKIVWTLDEILDDIGITKG